MNVRDSILESIRRATGPAPIPCAPDYAAIGRDYEVNGSLGQEDRKALFLDRLREYGAGAYQCAERDLAETVRGCLAERQRSSIIVPLEIPASWLPPGFPFVADNALTWDALDKSDGALTGCTLGIASTGSLVMHQAASQGRRALTLVPDYHLCIVAETQIVETVPEAIRHLAHQGIAAATIISGPSATSDIEMTRIKGVHGPRTLDVIVFR